MYTWNESEGHKGSNEIASMLYHRLMNTEMEGINRIMLYADGCPGQNKNVIVIGMLAKWLATTTTRVTFVQITFPIVGHSFLPSDRIFGRVEKSIRKLKTIVNPDEYKTIFKDYGTVLELGKHFEVYNWKEKVESTIKPTAQWHFRFAAAKKSC